MCIRDRSDPSLLKDYRTTGHLDANQNTNYNQNWKQEDETEKRSGTVKNGF